MLRYGDEMWTELKFTAFQYSAEKRDKQWVDVELIAEVAEETPVPTDVIELSFVAVCTHEGHPIQLIVLEEGIDSEYQLTMFEKEQLESFVRTDEVQKAIREAVAASVN
jgi:hypothetical protein